MIELFGFIFALFIILALREIYCWYAKINSRVTLMEKQLDQSKETNRLLNQLLKELSNQSDVKSSSHIDFKA